MTRFVTRIASISGQRWRRLFERIGRRLRGSSDPDSGAVRVATGVIEGFIVKAVRRKNVLTTQVIDPPGHYLGVTSGREESSFLSPFQAAYWYPAPSRDIFNSQLSIAPAPAAFKTLIQPTGATLTGSLGNKWGDQGYWFRTSAPSEYQGVAYGYATASTTSAASDGRGTTITNGAQFMAGIDFAASLSHAVNAASRLPTVTIYCWENAFDSDLPGYRPITRYAATAKISRQLPYVAAARDGDRMAWAMPLTTNPAQAASGQFPHRGGDLALVVAATFMVPIDDTGSFTFTHRTRTLRLADVPEFSQEAWSDVTPWLQEYTDASFDPPKIRTVIYPPAGGFLYDGKALAGNLSCAFGAPTMCLKGNAIEVLVDVRVARPWVDDRGIDKYPELTPVTIQTQTAVLRITAPSYQVDNPDALGPLSVDIVQRDASGAEANGCYAALGATDPTGHNLWRTLWSGNAGGRHVALLSAVRHKRFERYAGGWLQTAQSSFSGGQSVQIRNEDGVAVDSYSLPPPELADDPLAIQLYVDGVLTTHLSSAIGLSFWPRFDESELRQDDYYWPFEATKWATVAGDDIVFFAAYSYPTPDHIVLMRWDVSTGALTEIRRDPRTQGGYTLRPALSCYQRQVKDENGQETAPACVLYRIGTQTGPGRVLLSKDYGVTWSDLVSETNASGGIATYTPAMGLYYFGSPLWHPPYGDTFRDYR